jgi:hypothetical protein
LQHIFTVAIYLDVVAIEKLYCNKMFSSEAKIVFYCNV